MKGKIIIKVDGVAEVYKDISVESAKDAQLKVMSTMQSIQEESPFLFVEVEPFGQCMVDSDGRLWQFEFVKNEEVESFMKKADESLAARQAFDSLTDEEKNDIIEVEGKRYVRKIYKQKWDKEHTTQIKLKLNNSTDNDILKHLEKVDNKQGYIKRLIRADIRK